MKLLAHGNICRFTKDMISHTLLASTSKNRFTEYIFGTANYRINYTKHRSTRDYILEPSGFALGKTPNTSQ